MGKITKPQKSTKHKKMKSIDPFYVGNRPTDKRQDQFNLKPKGKDDWDSSRSLDEIIRLKNEAKMSGEKRKKNRNKFKNLDAERIMDNLTEKDRGVTKAAPSVPEFKQRKGESDERFMYRVDRETSAVINKAHFEDKFHLGEDPSLFKTKQKKKKENQSESAQAKKKERLSEKRKKIENRKRNKIEDRCGGFSALRDEVKFGEVAQEPPQLTVKPRKSAHINNEAKIGSKQLLLNNLLLNDGDEEKSAASRPVVQREVGKTVKRKKLSPAEQRIMDKEREKAIEIYRKLKHKQLTLPSSD